MRDLEPGEAYVSTRRHSGVYHTWTCGRATRLKNPRVTAIDDLSSTYEHCAFCERGEGADMRVDSVPEAVACPCGSGYAERRPEPIVEIVNGSWRQRRVTHAYRHDGCPVGGHIVEQAGRIRVAGGPLFAPDRYSKRAIEAATPEVVADGGEPEDADVEGVYP